jgi:hypothetical protein
MVTGEDALDPGFTGFIAHHTGPQPRLVPRALARACPAAILVRNTHTDPPVPDPRISQQLTWHGLDMTREHFCESCLTFRNERIIDSKSPVGGEHAEP